MPCVAIITPVYNAAAFVEKTILSVLAQTYQNWQLILVDDGSTDNSLEICRKYENDSRIKVVTQKNSGVATARNLGLSLACNAKYYTFLDSDDLLVPDFLRTAVAFLESNLDFTVFKTNFWRIDENGKFFKSFLDRRIWNQHRVTWNLFSESLDQLFLLLGTFPPVGILVRNTDDVPLFFNTNLQGTEDSELWTRLALNGKKFFYSDFVGGVYRIRPASLSTNHVQRMDNYKKWLDHSFSSVSTNTFDESFVKFAYFMILLQSSIGVSVDDRISKTELLRLGKEFMPLCLKPNLRHLFFSRLVHSSIESRRDLLVDLQASHATVMSCDLFDLKNRPSVLKITRFLRDMFLRPLQTIIAVRQLLGKQAML